jgi:hypothetical protein
MSRLERSARAFAHNMKFTQNTMISSFTRVGEEFERHLDRDIRELKLANDLLKALNTRSEAYLSNGRTTQSLRRPRARQIMSRFVIREQ